MKHSLLHLTLILAAILLLGTATTARAELVPVGGEILVNTITAGRQADSDVAMDSEGNFVVTWTTSPSFFGGEIAGQLFDDGGTPIGSQFQINTFTNDTQSNPKVAMTADGGFVVVWLSFRQFPPAIVSIIGRLYNSAGAPLGGEFEVSQGQTAIFPDVAMATDGSFMVVYQGRPAGAGGQNNLFARLYDASGAALTAPIQVSSSPAFSFGAAVTATPDGGWLVAWTPNGNEVFTRRLDADGAPLGAETRIGINGNSTAVAAGGDRIVAGWELGGALEFGGPSMQLFDGTFAPVTGLLQSSTVPALPSQEIALAVDASGSFAVAWTEKDRLDNNDDVVLPTRDGDASSIVARIFDAWGSAGNDFVVNTTAESFQAAPSVALSPAGRLVVTWSSPGADFTDDILGQVYKPNAAPVALCQNLSLAAGPSCAVNASVDNGSFDPDSGDSISLFQTPPGPYGLGVNNIFLTVLDDNGTSDTCSATVTVIDVQAPAITCPADITTDAAIDSSGAVVAFVAAAADACDPAPDVVFSPASGSVFPFGITTVSASATDDSGNAGTCTFTVTVLTPLEQIDAVTGEIDALVTAGSLPPNTANALIGKLEQASAKIDAGQLGPACNKLGAFINQVNANIGNGNLTGIEGQSLIDPVNAIRANLGC